MSRPTSSVPSRKPGCPGDRNGVARCGRRGVRGEHLGEQRDERDEDEQAHRDAIEPPDPAQHLELRPVPTPQLRQRDGERFCDGHQPTALRSSRSGSAVRSIAISFESPSCTRRHEIVRPSPPSRTGTGTVSLHSSNATGQRGWNEQPPGGSTGLAGSPCERNVHHVGAGHRREQAARVRVYRRGAHFFGRPEFHDAAEVHHRDPVGDDARGREVVRDEQHRHPELAPESADEVERGGRERHVERARRLVAEQQRGRNDGRAGERGALALAPGELGGLGLRHLGRQPDEGQCFGDAFAGAGCGPGSGRADARRPARRSSSTA